MARLKAKTRQRLRTIAYVLVVSVLILLMPARLTAPARILFTQAVGSVEDLAFQTAGDTLAATGTLRDAILSQERDRRLRRDLVRLLNERGARKERIRALELRLRSIGALRVEEFPCRPVSARVTAYDSSPMHRSITIGVGTRHGVRQGLIVCSAGAVIGQVIEAGPWFSRVRLITDSASSLPCRVSRTRNRCILQGAAGPSCSVEWVDRDADVRAGDVLVTAPVDHVLSQPPLVPAGLPVATVKGVKRSPMNPLFLDVTAAPRVNLARLEMVEVIVPGGPEDPG